MVVGRAGHQPNYLWKRLNNQLSNNVDLWVLVKKQYLLPVFSPVVLLRNNKHLYVGFSSQESPSVSRMR